MDATLKWCSTPPLWRIDAVGRRPPYQSPAAEETAPDTERAAIRI
jgi:hypothetical protein